MTRSEGCVYCGGLWNDATKQMDHTRTCYIVTGHLTAQVARRAKAERERRAQQARLESHGFLSEPDEGGL